MSGCSQNYPVIDVVIKFGGSSITNKNNLETLKTNELQRAAECVLKCQKAGLNCLVVHGAGSFGHHHAKQYQVNSGFDKSGETDQHKMWGYVLTRQSVTKLNKNVVDSLIQNGVYAIGCSPGCSWVTNQRIPVKWAANEIGNFLKMGMVPVFHGDCCIDESLGCCILSGDTIIQSLCSHFEVKRVVFLTDVLGVFDRPPDEPGAKLLKNITVRKDGTMQTTIKTSNSPHDVTGGIKLKLKTATKIIATSKTDCPVYVCSINSPVAETLCQRNRLKDEDLDATEITLSS